jgi:hypothetical protein
MPVRSLLLLLALCCLACLPCFAEDKEKQADFAFEMKEIDKSLTVGYAVLLVDVNGDKKTDIVVVDSHRVVWYENPSWKRRLIIDKTTKADNVCAAALDIDGDGKIDLAVGAEWKPFNTTSGGTLQWLKQPDDLDKPWKLYPISDDEPTIHRIRFADVDGKGKPALVVGPLMGRGSSAAKNWQDGKPLRLSAYRIPKDPTKDRWVPEVIDESLRVMHNFDVIPAKSGKGNDLLTASYDGVHLLQRKGEKWSKTHLGTGNQDKPKASRGSSEIKRGKLRNGREFIATIEPWHGDQVVVYTQPEKDGEKWTRRVIDDKLKWGHAVWCADLDGDGADELVIGVRGMPDDLKTQKEGERRGVRVYKALDDKGTKWKRQVIDDGGIAVEDAACVDLDGDGKIDVVAVGRFTKNVRIYRNVSKK